MTLNSKDANAGGANEVESEEIAPEILAAIAAAVTVFLGRKFRLLSVSRSDLVSRWTNQGRAVVQGSHNVRRKNR